MKIYFAAALSLLIFFISAICLQIFLSKKENKWYGLVFAIVLFLIMPIICWIFFPIHFYQRRKFKTNKELEKMNIQDL